MIKKQFIWILTLMLYLVVGVLFNSAQGQPTTTPSTPYSVFVGDTCSAPCWFDLTPGVSTTADVEAMLERHVDVFYVSRAYDDENAVEDTPVVNGWYSLFWQYYRGNRMQIDPSRIRMQDGVVYFIDVRSQAETGISEVLSIYGEPDYIWSMPEWYINLIYVEEMLVISLRNDSRPVAGAVEDNFALYDIVFYSPRAVIEETLPTPSNRIGSLLNPPNARSVRHVPYDVLICWLMETDCVTWDELSNDVEVPIMMTLTPAATTTPISSR